jgi:hypothetical protein
MVVKIHATTMKPTMSLNVKNGWKGIFDRFELVPRGLFDPVWWRNRRWTITNPIMMKGRMKWKEKNRVSVALSTANPPQIHCTRVFPMYGIAESRLVITVAAQKDICPQISTYPMKAVAISASIMIVPTNHV